MHRKYFAEFALNVFTSYKAFVPLELIAKYDDGHNYNIYAITCTSRIYIDLIEITDDNKYEVKFHYFDNEQRKENSAIIEHFFLDLPAQVTKTKIDKNGEQIKVIVNETHIKEACSRLGISPIPLKSENGNCCINIESSHIFYEHCNATQIPFDVLYIGQSYGRKGKRSAQQRLKSHEKLQAILTDFHANRRDERIYVFLFELDILHLLSLDGINSKDLVNRELEKDNFNHLMDYEHKENQIINLYEAALINYFKPPYNVNLINNFPNKGSKGYADYYSLDYNKIVIEIDLEFDMMTSVVLRTPTSSMSCFERFITYRLHNDPNRADMFDLFLED